MSCRGVTTYQVPANPAALGTAVLFDSTKGNWNGVTLSQRGNYARRGATRIECGWFPSDQAVTLNVYKINQSETSWPATPILTVAIGAGTDYVLDEKWYGDDMKITVVNGAVAPTTVSAFCRVTFGDRSAGV